MFAGGTCAGIGATVAGAATTAFIIGILKALKLLHGPLLLTVWDETQAAP